MRREWVQDVTLSGRSRTSGVAIGLGALALLVSSCVSAAPPQGSSASGSTEGVEPGSLDAYYNQQLDWEACGAALCADLKVPKDHDDPSKGDFNLALVKREADGDSKGALVVNPGGPGGSGVDYAKAAASVLPTPVNRSFDIVGFDPRGVADSDPVDCLSDAETDAWLAADGLPNSEEEAAQLDQTAAELGQKCAEKSADVYPYLGTESVVKDMDILRAALGEDQLNYVGKSYGTLIGALYADEFPDKVGRFVLDGVLPPDLSAEEIGRGQAEGFEETLRRFVADCQKKSCPLTDKSVDAGVKQIQDFLNGLADKPIEAEPGRPMTESLALGAILYYMYFPAFGDWDQLADGLKAAFDGDGGPLLRMYDLRLERSRSGRFADNSQDAFYAVTCLDRAVDVDVDSLTARADDWETFAPTFGPYMAWSDLVCSKWPTEATGVQKTVNGKGANPILIVSTTHDPATPYKWAKRLAGDLQGSKLVTWDTDGHTAYGNGSACVDRVVDAYLIDGTMPKSNVTCR